MNSAFYFLNEFIFLSESRTSYGGLRLESSYRATVIESLKRIFKDKSYSNLVINNDIRNINYRYNALYRKSVLGVIENLIFIDWIINRISSVKTKKLETEILVTLRLAVYQLFFLQNSYENIVVSESVQHIKDTGNIKASKFVNAVLRNIIRSKDRLLEDMNNLPYEEYLCTKYSYPGWLVAKWIKKFGRDTIEEVLIKNNSEAPLEIRVNTLKISGDELMSILEAKGINTQRCKIAERGLIIENPSELDKLEEYKNGLFSIQGESSMLVGQILNPKEGSLIVDLCAAPGGKSLNVAESINNTGKIISRDIYNHKLSLINKEIKRLGITNIKTEEYDATETDASLLGRADYCIVDVPCSGLGIIRRKPEIKYKEKDNKCENINEIQYKILQNASSYLKVGATLVYSTCTTNKEENIDIVNRFLKENKDFVPVNITEETKNCFSTASQGYIEIYPHIHNMDGFFIAKLKKI